MGCFTGVCVCQGSEHALLAAHRHATGKSLLIPAPLAARRESSGRFVLRRRRRCPVRLLPECCILPRGDRACFDGRMAFTAQRLRASTHHFTGA